MDDLSYETEDYSNETASVPNRTKKMKKAYPSMDLGKNVPSWLAEMDTDKDKEFKIEAVVAKTRHDEDQEYGNGKVRVSLSFRSIRKISNTRLTKKEYLNAGEEERAQHNQETVMGEE